MFNPSSPCAETDGAHSCPECEAYNDSAHYSKRKNGVRCQVDLSHPAKLGCPCSDMLWFYRFVGISRYSALRSSYISLETSSASSRVTPRRQQDAGLLHQLSVRTRTPPNPLQCHLRLANIHQESQSHKKRMAHFYAQSAKHTTMKHSSPVARPVWFARFVVS